MAKIITVVNQKGGVGKTTITCNLAFAAAELGKTVLVIDFDSQSNSSQILTMDAAIKKTKGGSELLFKKDKLVFTKTAHENIELLHGHAWLELLDPPEQGVLKAAETKSMRLFIRNLPFDYVLFDTPPATGPRQVAPLFWSDMVVIPLEPDGFSQSGLSSMLETTINPVKRAINPGLIVKVILNRFKKSSLQHKETQTNLKKKLGSLYMGELSDRVHVADSLSRSTPVWKYTRYKNLRDEWKQFVNTVFKNIA